MQGRTVESVLVFRMGPALAQTLSAHLQIPPLRF
jgi:hypothetical protein